MHNRVWFDLHTVIIIYKPPESFGGAIANHEPPTLGACGQPHMETGSEISVGGVRRGRG